MSSTTDPGTDERLVRLDSVSGRERYQLLTSLVAPRPIAWVSTRSTEGLKNLAPFSYFAPVSPSPPLVSIAIGSRRGAPKDTLANIRQTRSFCINVVTEQQMVQMNASSGEHPPEIDEFEIAGVEAAAAELVDAPYVAGCPAVLECRLYKEIDLSEAGVALVIGEILAARLAPGIMLSPGTFMVEPDSLHPVARLGGELYSMRGEMTALTRPIVPR